MLAKVYSAAVYGVEAFEVEIEVNAGGGGSKIIIVGLPDAAVKESQDRVTTAIQNSGYHWPHGRTTINLAPADVKKEGPSFDLPIALGMIAAGDDLDLADANKYCFVGELALTGAVRSVKGILPIALEAKRRGKKAIFVPEANAKEAAVVEGIDVYGVRNLREVFQFLKGDHILLPVKEDLTAFFEKHRKYDLDFADVKGQQQVNQVPVTYDPGATCPCFEKFLKDALPEADAELVQKWAGMALGGVNFAQSILLITGVAGAGKGVTVDVITRVIGLENYAQLRTIHLESRFETARFIGKTLLVGADVRGDFLDLNGAQMLKALTGGDPQTTELKGQNQPVSIKGNFNVVITSNRRLRVSLDGDDDAWERRLKLIEFTRRAERHDPDLATKLVNDESPGIINWMLEGLAKLRRDYSDHAGWQLTEQQHRRTQNLLLESNSLLAFVAAQVEAGNQGASVTVGELRTAYETFCSDRNWTPQTKHVIERGLPDILQDKFGVSRRNDVLRGGTQHRGWIGVKLINLVDEEEFRYVPDRE